MGNIINYFDSDDTLNLTGRYLRWSSKRVLLREPEVCLVCNKEFLSLYPLKKCTDHVGLDGV